MQKMMVIIVGLLLTAKCMAATHYVVPPGTAGVTATAPYTNWATAGTNLIDVVNAAMTNSTPRIVWVTNGNYRMTNVINVTNSLTIRSINGRDFTSLNGNSPFYTNRCIYYSANEQVFDGFTVSNYYNINGDGIIFGNNYINIYNCSFTGNTNKYGTSGGNGGAVYINQGGQVTNCIFKNNYASTYGGAMAGADIRSYLKIDRCRFENNIALNIGGGALYLRGYNISVSNCVIVNNRCSSLGGGIDNSGGNNYGDSLTISKCSITGNIVDCQGSVKSGIGGGVACYGQTTIKDCSIIGNVSTNISGGVWGTNLTMRNSLIALNRASTNIGGGVWMTNGIVESCTIVSNYAGVAGGGLYFNGPAVGTNNIVYFNTAPNGANFTNTAGNAGLNYSCVIPAVNGAGNITNNPVLKNLAGGDYRLRMTSPCVNAGTNQPWMTNAVDLEGNARILKNIVDMGTYETRIWQGTIFRVP